MLDWPAFGNALWLVSDQLGIRPEWQLPVIYLETAHTLDPSIVNPGGCVGINQFCPPTYSYYVHVPVSEYRTWTASRQLSGPVLAYWRDALKYGPIDSAARLMVAQLSQRKLATVTATDSVVFSAPSAEYAQNSSFDLVNKGYFTVQDLADVLTKQTKAPAVQDALARAYAMRPNEIPHDSYGYSLVTPPLRKPGIAAAAIGMFALVGAVSYGIYKSLAARPSEPDPELTPRPIYPPPQRYRPDPTWRQ